jgi:proteic killer suppression protein
MKPERVLSAFLCFEFNERLAPRSAPRYTLAVIKSFKHGGLEKFFKTGSKAGIQPAHARKLQDQLLLLHVITKPEDMNTPGWGLHPLREELAGHWSVKVNGNWRMTCRFEGEDAILVDYQVYH